MSKVFMNLTKVHLECLSAIQAEFHKKGYEKIGNRWYPKTDSIWQSGVEGFCNRTITFLERRGYIQYYCSKTVVHITESGNNVLAMYEEEMRDKS